MKLGRRFDSTGDLDLKSKSDQKRQTTVDGDASSVGASAVLLAIDKYKTVIQGFPKICTI